MAFWAVFIEPCLTVRLQATWWLGWSRTNIWVRVGPHRPDTGFGLSAWSRTKRNRLRRPMPAVPAGQRGKTRLFAQPRIDEPSCHTSCQTACARGRWPDSAFDEHERRFGVAEGGVPLGARRIAPPTVAGEICFHRQSLWLSRFMVFVPFEGSPPRAKCKKAAWVWEPRRLAERFRDRSYAAYGTPLLNS